MPNRTTIVKTYSMETKLEGFYQNKFKQILQYYVDKKGEGDIFDIDEKIAIARKLINNIEEGQADYTTEHD